MNSITRHRRCIGLVLLVAALGSSTSQARLERPAQVDLTKDGNALKYIKEEGVLLRTYNLGPTGMRGWMYDSWSAEDSATQILVTQVETNSPADGRMVVADVILGVDGERFTKNARKTFALAIGTAESEKQQGRLPLLVWRDGKELSVTLQLKVMGTYSDTAPYNCAKSARILAEGCEAIVRNGNNWGRFDLEGMVLLASGKKEYLPIIRERAAKMASSADTSNFVAQIDAGGAGIGRAWNGGYGGLFWTEYCLVTGDKQMLPWVRANAVNVARGQGMWGTYGHGYSLRKPNGDLHGIIPPYGALNQAGLGCFLTMVLARNAGVKDAELNEAIERSNKFFKYYTGKGTIPYGEHRPEVWAAHNNNGNSGLASHAFAAQGNHRKEAQFWARMCTAGYRELEHGHAGPFFSFLWGTMGASVAGPEAAAAYFKEIAWHFDLERRWDGSFAYTASGGGGGAGYQGGVSATGAYLLTFALPARQLTITGRNPDKALWLEKKEVARAVHSGRYDHKSKSIDELLASLGSWSPAERLTAAQELAERKEDILPRVMQLAEGRDPNAMIGVCHVLAHLKERSLPAMPLLIRWLEHEDPWVRVQAAEALKTLGETARPAVPAMLKAVAATDESDPLRFGQGSLCYALFYPGGNVAGSPGLLGKSIEGVDRDLLYPAIRAVSVHPDGHARGCLRSTYSLLTLEDVKALLPEIVASADVDTMAPCNTMFSKGVMLAAVRALADHRVAEGLPLAIELDREWNFHGAGYVHQYIANEVKRYGGAARSTLPYWQEQLKKQPDAKLAREVIDAIEGDKNPPKLITLGEFMTEEQRKRLQAAAITSESK